MWRMRQNVSEGFEDIEGFEKLKTSKPSIPSFCILRIYLLIFREIDFFTNFHGLLRMSVNVSVEIRSQIVSYSLSKVVYVLP